MAKPPLDTIPPFYHGYVNLVKQELVLEAIQHSSREINQLFESLTEADWDHRYQPGKWSVKEVLQHLLDSERVFSFRAMSISRKEQQSLPGFDEGLYAANAEGNRRKPESLLQEWTALRLATELLFDSFSSQQLNATGIANQNPISVVAIGFITAGHTLHHLAVIKERYFPHREFSTLKDV